MYNISVKPSQRILGIEEEIKARIATEEEEYELDDSDRQEIRDEIYQSHGFDGDPFSEEDEDVGFDIDCDLYGGDYMSHKLAEIGMCERDFF